MAAELAHLHRLGASKVIFLDDSFANDKARIAAFCELLRSRPCDVVWGCLCRVEDVSLHLLKAMAAAGCRWIHLGIEHGTPEVRARIGKRFSDAEAIDACSQARSMGIRLRTSWILDLPDATSTSLDETVNLAVRTGSEEIKLHFLVTRPGSTMYSARRASAGAFDEGDDRTAGETFIHVGRPLTEGVVPTDEVLGRFRRALEPRGYQFVDDVRFWRAFDGREAAPDSRFLSTVVTRYGLGWK